MILEAQWLFLKDLVGDILRDPSNLKRYANIHQRTRSLSIPQGNLPQAPIFQFVPEAMTTPIIFQSVFEVPPISQNMPNEKETYLASTTMVDTTALLLLAKKFATKRIVEVGTSYGQSALLFALNTPPGCEIITLDIQNPSDNPTVGMYFRDEPAVAGRIKFKISSLKQLAATLEPKSCDLIFIDGDHSYAGVMEDTLAALPLLRPGGVLCWHDYYFRFRHDVVKALDELREKNGLDIYKIAYTNVAAAIVP